jgi:origin recognition complex subunit 5
LLEKTIAAVIKAIDWKGDSGRVENISQLVVEVSRLLKGWASEASGPGKRRLVLVFDGIDHQRDAPPTLLPALARLGEAVSFAAIL